MQSLLITLLFFICNVFCYQLSIPDQELDNVVGTIMDHLDSNIDKSTDKISQEVAKSYPNANPHTLKKKTNDYLNKSLKSKIMKDLRPMVKRNIQEGLEDIRSANSSFHQDKVNPRFMKFKIRKIAKNIQEEGVLISQKHLNDFTFSHEKLYMEHMEK